MYYEAKNIKYVYKNLVWYQIFIQLNGKDPLGVIHVDLCPLSGL